jgi:lipid A 3-O-deacylase
MLFKNFITVSFVLLISGQSFAWDDSGSSLLYKTVFGILAHDRGPTSDRHESGVDPNWELQFNRPHWKPWRWIGSPFPMVGATPNFTGDTSVLYAGLTYELSLSNKHTNELTYGITKHLFVAGGISAALHDGPVHKAKDGCNDHSDCGFGYRVLPRLNVEFGTKFLDSHAISFFYDHMSHKKVLGGENEGIDHIGIRYHYMFKNLGPEPVRSNK